MNNNAKKNNLRDKIAGIIFTNEDCRDYVIKVVSVALDIKENIIRSNLKLITPRINTNINIKYNYVDAVYENDSSIINIEINFQNSNKLQNKNLRYVCQLVLKQDLSGTKNIKLKPIYQININNFDHFKKGKFIYKSSIREESYNLKRDDFITIIDINVDFLSHINYNEIKEDKNSLEYLLYLFICDDETTLDKLYLNDKIMEEIKKKVSVLKEDFLDGLYYDREELIRESYFEDGKNNKAKEIAKKMLSKGKSIEEVIEFTELSKEDIENL